MNSLLRDLLYTTEAPVKKLQVQQSQKPSFDVLQDELLRQQYRTTSILRRADSKPKYQQRATLKIK